MSRVMLLDRVIGDSFPSLASAADIKAFEGVPYRERIAAASTFDAIKLGAAHNPDATAIQFLPNASPEDTPIVITHGQLVARVTQAANMFHALGVGAGDVVSFLLPLLPQSFFTLFGAEAAGIANPVNPLLEAHQIAEILEAAGTKVLVALGPTAGTDIWDKVVKVRGQLKQLKAIVQVNGPGDEANAIYAFDALISKQPADRLVSGRQIAAGDVAAYFHTGGTTGTPKLVSHTHANQVYQAWACNLMFRPPMAATFCSACRCSMSTRTDADPGDDDRADAAWWCCRRPVAKSGAMKNLFRWSALSSGNLLQRTDGTRGLARGARR